MPSGQMGPTNGHSATCRANQRPTRDWGEQRLSRTPSIKSGLGDVVAPALVTSSNRRDSKKIEVPTSSTGILARHGSVRAPPPTRHEVTIKLVTSLPSLMLTILSRPACCDRSACARKVPRISCTQARCPALRLHQPPAQGSATQTSRSAGLI